MSARDTEMNKTGTPPGGEKRYVKTNHYNIKSEHFFLVPDARHSSKHLIHVIFTIVAPIIVPTLQMGTENSHPRRCWALQSSEIPQRTWEGDTCQGAHRDVGIGLRRVDLVSYCFHTAVSHK